MPQTRRAGFIAFFVVAAIVLSRFSNFPIIALLLVSCIAGIGGALITRALLRMEPAQVKIGDQIFKYRKYASEFKKRYAELFLASLYYYWIGAVLVWSAISWATLAISFRSPLFYLRSTSALSSILVILYIALASSTLIWMVVYLSKRRWVEMPAVVIPMVIGVAGGVIESKVFHAGFWLLPIAGILYPRFLIPLASFMCTRAGLRTMAIQKELGFSPRNMDSPW